MDAGRFAGLFPSCFWELAGDSWLRGEKSGIFPKYKYYTKTPGGTQNIRAITVCTNVPRKNTCICTSLEGMKLLAGTESVGHSAVRRIAVGLFPLVPGSGEGVGSG